MLNRWCREAQRSSKPVFQGSGTLRDQELARLKRELAQVKKEREFLRDAATYFAKESS
jgi:transposase